MIDVENEILNAVKTAVTGAYSTAFVTGVYVSAPPTFPAVSVEESDNYVVRETQDSTHNENHDFLMYTVNVYSNKKDGKKAEAKAVFSIVDTVMLNIGFRRTMCERIPNEVDATIYRITARYEAVVGTNKVIYRG